MDANPSGIGCYGLLRIRVLNEVNTSIMQDMLCLNKCGDYTFALIFAFNLWLKNGGVTSFSARAHPVLIKPSSYLGKMSLNCIVGGGILIHVSVLPYTFSFLLKLKLGVYVIYVLLNRGIFF